MTAGRLPRDRPPEPELGQIEVVNEEVDDANWMQPCAPLQRRTGTEAVTLAEDFASAVPYG
jgi:hypothetical protein